MLRKLKTQILATVTTGGVFLGIGTVAFQQLEGWTWIESFYFSVTALTTVGFGDLHPTTDVSRLFASVYILIGVAIVLSSLGMLGTRYLHYREHVIGRIKKK